MKTFHNFIEKMPKVELHLHIEGSFEPELMFAIAQRNNIELPYKSVQEVKKAYNFNNLQEFLDIYYAGASVLLYEQDFYDLTWAYLQKIHSENVIHTEIFFDPQTHTDRGVSFDTVIKGIHRALEDAKAKFGISYKLIMSFLRHLSEKEAFKTLEQALPYSSWIDAVGLDSSELGNPPSKFERVYAVAKQAGFKLVAHAGEEGPAEYVYEALDLLKIDRLDHGNRSLENADLVDRLVAEKMALTVCPLSNLKLKVVKDLKNHPLKIMLNKSLLATVNSDDPAYFGGYMNDNFLAVTEALNLSKEDLYQLSINAIAGSFADEDRKTLMKQALDDYFGTQFVEGVYK
jgi:adenosine deaminase